MARQEDKGHYEVRRNGVTFGGNIEAHEVVKLVDVHNNVAFIDNGCTQDMVMAKELIFVKEEC